MNKEIQIFSNPKKDLLLIVVAVLIGFVLSQFIAGLYILIVNFFLDVPLKIEGISSIILNSNMRIHFLVIQSFTSLIVFFLAPYIYLKGKKEFLTKILSFTKVQISPLLILFLCTIFFMLFNGLIVEWNKNIEFPSFLSSFEEYLKVNVISLFSVCREFARNNEGGSIVNFSSTYGLTSPLPHLYDGKNEKHIGYGVSKSAVVQLTKHLATHLAPNFRVNCIAPGGVKFKQDDEFIKNYSEHTPMGRMMNVSELNGLIDYLCSEASSYMTGETISVDGGWTKW